MELAILYILIAITVFAIYLYFYLRYKKDEVVTKMGKGASRLNDNNRDRIFRPEMYNSSMYIPSHLANSREAVPTRSTLIMKERMKKEIINELRGSAVKNPIEQEYVTNYGLNYPEMRALSASKSGSPTPGTARASIEKAAAAAEAATAKALTPAPVETAAPAKAKAPTTAGTTAAPAKAKAKAPTTAGTTAAAEKKTAATTAGTTAAAEKKTAATTAGTTAAAEKKTAASKKVPTPAPASTSSSKMSSHCLKLNNIIAGKSTAKEKIQECVDSSNATDCSICNVSNQNKWISELPPQTCSYNGDCGKWIPGWPSCESSDGLDNKKCVYCPDKNKKCLLGKGSGDNAANHNGYNVTSINNKILPPPKISKEEAERNLDDEMFGSDSD
jgi:hypothetical protein